ncbi:MAG: carbon-nitrogen hydrolase [Bacteroidales bacterium]|nr:carbon-nitrogen hydrolase [Bacteroidales bacterium]
MNKVKVGLAQMSCVADKQQNIVRYTDSVRRLAAEGAQIICLQELFATLYFCDEERYEAFALAEAVPEGPTTRHFQELARELGVVIVCSLFEKRAEGLYHNTTAVIDADGSYLGKYRKMHIPDDPGFYEKFYFTPGDLGYKVFRTRFATIGVLICWDQWFPEASRITALMGAEILFYPTAIGWDVRQKEADNREQYEAWQTIQRSHAVANGVPVVSVNRTGREGGMQFWGGSFVANAFGRVLWQAPHLEEAWHVEELDLDQSDHYRRHWPYLRDRRIDSYDSILKRYIDEE